MDFRSAELELPDLTVNGKVQSAWHERAAAATRAAFGRSVFVRAVVELSNVCREQCAYCGMRRGNTGLKRYRAHWEQLAEMILEQRPATVTDINLQAGEDPVAVREVALPLIQSLRRHTDLVVSVCLGTLDDGLYRQLKDAGASIYIMKFECADSAQYRRHQAPGTLEERTAHVRRLAAQGWAVSSGFIVGLPDQDAGALRQCVKLAVSLPLRGCSVSPFIPGEATPLAGYPAANSNWTLNCMAALRLSRPEWIIPAVSALNLAEADGYRRGLRAGANLVTVNMTPEAMRGDYVIYKRDRFIMTEQRVLEALSAEDLTPSTLRLAEHFRQPAAPQAAPVPVCRN